MDDPWPCLKLHQKFRGKILLQAVKYMENIIDEAIGPDHEHLHRWLGVTKLRPQHPMHQLPCCLIVSLPDVIVQLMFKLKVLDPAFFHMYFRLLIVANHAGVILCHDPVLHQAFCLLISLVYLLIALMAPADGKQHCGVIMAFKQGCRTLGSLFHRVHGRLRSLREIHQRS